MPSDLAVEAFLTLRTSFFAGDGTPQPFTLRDKRDTQDDPFDEHVAGLLGTLGDARCQKASGPLTTPDMVVYRPVLCDDAPRAELAGDLSRALAIEVKKVGRTKSGQVARSTGLDYNSTPPCGTVRVYDATARPVDLPAFYLFACIEPGEEDTKVVTGLALCDGDALNRDFDLYLRMTGRRTKVIELGTYKDGVDRTRPMFLFANALGARQIDHHATLITRVDFEESEARLRLVYQIGRIDRDKTSNIFHAYRVPGDLPDGWEPEHLVDPFPQPLKRSENTQGRGKFRLPIRPSDPQGEAPAPVAESELLPEPVEDTDDDVPC